jgi:hypothetical protein
VGRGRCFVRVALVKKILSVPVDHLLKNKKLTDVRCVVCLMTFISLLVVIAVLVLVHQEISYWSDNISK